MAIRKNSPSGSGNKRVLKGKSSDAPARAGRPAAPRRDKAEDPRERGTRGKQRFDKPKSAEPERKPARKAPSKYGKKEGESTYSRPDNRYRKPYPSRRPSEKKSDDGLMRLNKFLSNAGIASRRDADKLIELGLVTVNGKVVTELGMKVDPRADIVRYDDRSLKPEPFRYVLLNKPKDFITTMDDPDGRKTVMSLVESACKERIYPVGRLDRQTTGLLLFTNDGDLAKRLTHPKHGIAKLYHVETLEKVNGDHLDAVREGIHLEDGFIKADEISFVNGDPRHVGIRIHSGKNRIVRRIFEHYGYTVKKLDRVMFAGLTKKDLSRGRYRHLSEQEVNYLKMIR